MANLPTEREAYVVQLLETYLACTKPAATYAESNKEFTTQQVIEGIEPMLSGLDELTVYGYLVEEGYKTCRVGDEVVWIAIAG